MPLPFLLLGGAALVAGALGIEGHSEAKETNKQASSLCLQAQQIYDGAKTSLESSQTQMQNSLEKLGRTKGNVLDTSMDKFLKSYEYIKEVRIKEFNIEELSKFTINSQQVIEMQELSSSYKSALVSGATSAAAGAVIALAANGMLPFVTSLATGAISVGSVGMLGTALSFGASCTPLSAVLAPAIFFSGITAAIKADENLEKAQAFYEEARAAVEQMKVSQTMCDAIEQRSRMFEVLLKKLDGLFLICTNKLEKIITQKLKESSNGTIHEMVFTNEEVELIAITRALAGAVKVVIDTPILSKEGKLTKESQNVASEIADKLPDFQNDVHKKVSLN